MTVPNDWQPVASTHRNALGSRLSLRLLCILVVLYIPVQWVVGRHPGSTSIFSAQHDTLAREFLDMDGALRSELLAQCKEHGVHDIFFSDADVVSPYLANQVAGTSGCVLHRELEITPISPEQKLGCSALIVDESLPDAWNPVHHWEDLGAIETDLASVREWQSVSKQFGFKLLARRGCRPANENTEAE